MPQPAARENPAPAEARKKTDKRELKIVRRLPAKPEQVFRAFIDPKRLARWGGPPGVTVPVCAVDHRPGGKWRTPMRSPGGTDRTVSGVYQEVSRPSRLVFTWAWHED